MTSIATPKTGTGDLPMKQVKRALIAALAVAAVLLVLATAWTIRTLSDLPDVSVLKRYRPAAASEVLDRNGAVLTHFYEKKFRVWVPIDAVPPLVIQAVVTAEDDTFFGHKGVNYRAVWDALKVDVQKKRFARGGSTITQQMIKNVLLTKEKTLARKVREIVLARRAEEILTKRQILAIYLNEVEWGDGLYGIEAASRYYFDKHVEELDAAEAALLAGMLPNPRYYNPFKRPEKALQRREQVLFNMFQAKLLTEQEYTEAVASPLQLRDPGSRRFDFPLLVKGEGRPCYQRVLEQVLLRQFGERRLYREGLEIRTSLDKTLQDGFPPLTVPAGAESDDIPSSVVAVTEDGEVRAIVCDADEEQVQAVLPPQGSPGMDYRTSVLSIDELSAIGIVQRPGETAPAVPEPLENGQGVQSSTTPTP